MPAIKEISLGRFRLDLANECLWEGAAQIALRPKAYAVLKHLVDHGGQLVTKRQLLDAAWQGTFVGDSVLKTTIRQLREAMGDDVESPQFIQTVHRRGYRFVGVIDAVRAEFEVATPGPAQSPGRDVLGRDSDLAKLQGWLDRALAGERQVIFVTGEAGIGKTTLVNALLEQAGASGAIGMARGQCLEQYGAGEAYLPVLDALSRLGRSADRDRLVTFLRRFAPAWLAELRSLINAPESEPVGTRPSGGATRERMLREIAEAVEAMTAESPLILVLEDLHWSDYSTLDLVAYLARRRDAARLMVIGTYRPVDVILGEHPLKSVKRELHAHGLCHELPLEYLTESAVAEYVGAKLQGHRLERWLIRLIHRRTGGNPLFLVNLVDYLIDEGVVANVEGQWQLRGTFAAIESSVPDNVRQLIEKQIERLTPDERTVLEGASVVGMECSVVAISAGLERPTDWVEEHCEALVRRHRFLSAARLVELPDGTITPRYRFTHVLYLDMPYRLLPAMRRAQIHSRIGASGEAIYQARVGEIAAELAMHFEQGRDLRRAAKYLLQAAENARNRSAHHEAEALARRGLQAVDALPPGAGRDAQELGFRLILGVAVMAISGFAAAEAKVVLAQALDLCARLEAPSQAFMVEWLLGLFHYFRGEITFCRGMVSHLLERANVLREPLMMLEAHRASGVTILEAGRCDEALVHLDKVTALYDPDRHRSEVPFGGQDPLVVSDCFAARALWMQGYPDQALRRVERALAYAHQLGHVESVVIAMHFTAHLHQLRGEAALSQERAERVIAMSEEYGLAVWIAFGHMNRGWARLEQHHATDGLQELRQGLSAYELTGARLWMPYFRGLLARALSSAGNAEEAETELAQAISSIRDSGEYWPAAELYRLQAELLAAQGRDAREVQSSFQEALRIARDQHARSWELRVLTTASRPSHRQTFGDDAGRALGETYDWFSEGHRTADLLAAHRALRDARAGSPGSPRKL
jgi:DNA-binding winged helix-turn-helix (wHTH) protein/predicted ATPase